MLFRFTAQCGCGSFFAKRFFWLCVGGIDEELSRSPFCPTVERTQFSALRIGRTSSADYRSGATHLRCTVTTIDAKKSEVSRKSRPFLTLVTGARRFYATDFLKGATAALMEWTASPMKMLELERTATLRPFRSSIAGRSMISADRSNENTVVPTQLPIAGSWHLPEWIFGVSFFLSIMLAMAGWLYMLGALTLKVAFWLAS
ncbi:hypothetical protein [Bradyrhizobium sp. BWC-3-1]|uniref:hypothetical protein n=1 Tax=Bradyrhizobium sp. BWC-3-1 TaxID=3080012 RepID=UPI00293F4DA2|nr:hypothetical protein [Bradyrhizobium sp. BWC-3-1]WOH55354.1 hypothetical protein RX329_23895 [Bradyrhizobium sp. BWC-3-1]